MRERAPQKYIIIMMVISELLLLLYSAITNINVLIISIQWHYIQGRNQNF